MRPPRVPLGIGPPNVLQGTVSADTTTPTLTDLTSVTAVSLLVRLPGQITPVAWAASIVSATPPVGGSGSSLVWKYAFTGTESGTTTGFAVVSAQLTVPAGVVPCDAARFEFTSSTGGA